MDRRAEESILELIWIIANSLSLRAVDADLRRLLCLCFVEGKRQAVRVEARRTLAQRPLRKPKTSPRSELKLLLPIPRQKARWRSQSASRLTGTKK